MGIADHGTFSNAAEVLGTVQSNISNRIARLEDELGTELVNRSTGMLTESGEIVVDRARRILGELSAIAADVSELNADIRGQVVLGMIGTAGRWIVPLLLDALRTTYPQIALRIIEGSNSVIEPQLVHGRLDLAVLAWPVDAPELTSVELFSEDLVVIVDKNHALAKLDGPVSFATLAEYELLLPLGGTAHPPRDRRRQPSPGDRTHAAHRARRPAHHRVADLRRPRPVDPARDDALEPPARQLRGRAHRHHREAPRGADESTLRLPRGAGAGHPRTAARRGEEREERPRRRLPARRSRSVVS